MPNAHPAWSLIIVGLLLAGIGVVWLLAASVPWLGRLPGDIAVERGNTRIYIPLVTCLLLSAVLSLGLWIARRFFP